MVTKAFSFAIVCSNVTFKMNWGKPRRQYGLKGHETYTSLWGFLLLHISDFSPLFSSLSSQQHLHLLLSLCRCYGNTFIPRAMIGWRGILASSHAQLTDDDSQDSSKCVCVCVELSNLTLRPDNLMLMFYFIFLWAQRQRDCKKMQLMHL